MRKRDSICNVCSTHSGFFVARAGVRSPGAGCCRSSTKIQPAAGAPVARKHGRANSFQSRPDDQLRRWNARPVLPTEGTRLGEQCIRKCPSQKCILGGRWKVSGIRRRRQARTPRWSRGTGRRSTCRRAGWLGGSGGPPAATGSVNRRGLRPRETRSALPPG